MCAKDPFSKRKFYVETTWKIIIVGALGLLGWWIVATTTGQNPTNGEAAGNEIAPEDRVAGLETDDALVVADPIEKSLPRTGAIILSELRSTYRPGGLPARIRLQGELSDLWDQQPPTSAEVITQIGDKSAPDEHRVYIAQSFRNLAKMNRLEQNEAADVVDSMLGIVGNENDDPLVRGQLAVVVAGFDKSPEAVRVIAPLLNNANDDAGALAVTALRHMATDEAATALYNYLQRNVSEPDAKTKTISSALMALTGYEKIDVAPIAKRVVMQTQSVELFHGALLSLYNAESSEAVVAAIIAAYDNAERVQGIDPLRLKNACVSALKKHSVFIDNLEPAGDPSLVARAKEILKM